MEMLSIEPQVSAPNALATRLDLAVVIINYKTAEMTMACARSVLPEIEGLNALIVIVDNNSADGSVTKLQQWIATTNLENQIKLVPSAINLGFSGGNNLGMRQVDAEHYLLLNSDTLVRPGAIANLTATLVSAKNIGMASPRLEFEDGTGQISCFRFQSPLSEFIDIANTGLITRTLKNYNVPIELAKTITYPEWTSFACVMLKRTMIESIGLMDENYFLYFEDGDYCRTAKNAGWLIANTPDAHVVHFRGGSAELKHRKQKKQRLPSYYFNSRNYYYRKHYGKIGPLLANVMWTLGRSISLVRELLQQRPRAASERQWLDIWTSQRKSSLQ